MQLGKCSNFGNCDKADSRETLQIPDGADLVCPICHHQLTPIYTGGKTGKSPVVPVVVGVLTLLLLIGGGLLLTRKHGGDKSNETPQNGGTQQNSTAGGNGAGQQQQGGGGGATTPAPVILRLHGSNTIGSELGPALVEAFLRKKGATSFQTTDGPAEKPGEKSVEKTITADCPSGVFSEGNRVAVEVFAHGSATAFTDLAAGKCDIGCSSRKIKPDEATKLSAAGLGDLTSAAGEHVLGLDGIAVIVNAGNPITTLTKEQIAQIFTGQATNWSQVPGANGASGPITLYARDDKSGTYDTFKSLVLGDAKMAQANRFEDSDQLVTAVGKDAGGIGFISLTFVKDGLPIKALAVGNGVAARKPTIFTIQTEDYLLARRLFLYTPRSHKPLVDEFIAYAISDEGQDIVKNTGFVGQKLPDRAMLPAPPPLPSDAPADYIALVRNATRLPFNCRFRTGSDQLDNKAAADMDRLERWIAKNPDRANKIILIGFADSVGSDAGNLQLSKSRATSVAADLNRRGITPAVNGFGSHCRIAVPDKTEEDRAKNRRVEVWVRTN